MPKFIDLQFVIPAHDTSQTAQERHDLGGHLAKKLSKWLVEECPLLWPYGDGLPYVTFRVYDEHGVDEGPDDDL
jgi:hypothetical protein